MWVWPAMRSVYGCCPMIVSAFIEPEPLRQGAVVAVVPSCRTTKVYVVDLASSEASHVACAELQALQATNTNLAVQALPVPLTSMV